MPDPSYRVSIVVDQNFGSRLHELAARMHVWAVDTPPNRAAAERIWAKMAAPTIERGMTSACALANGATGERAENGSLRSFLLASHSVSCATGQAKGDCDEESCHDRCALCRGRIAVARPGPTRAAGYARCQPPVRPSSSESRSLPLAVARYRVTSSAQLMLL